MLNLDLDIHQFHDGVLIGHVCEFCIEDDPSLFDQTVNEVKTLNEAWRPD